MIYYAFIDRMRMFLKQTTLDLTLRKKKESIYFEHKACSSVLFKQIFARVSCVLHSMCTNISTTKKHSYFSCALYDDIQLGLLILLTCIVIVVVVVWMKCESNAVNNVRIRFVSSFVLFSQGTVYHSNIYIGCCCSDSILFFCNRWLSFWSFYALAKKETYVAVYFVCCEKCVSCLIKTEWRRRDTDTYTSCLMPKSIYVITVNYAIKIRYEILSKYEIHFIDFLSRVYSSYSYNHCGIT